MEVPMPMSSLLESDPDIHPLQGECSCIDDPTAAILDHLNEQIVISMDTLVCLMPQYTWNQIFYRVDQLSRSEKIVLRRHRCEYMLFSTHFVE